MSKRRGNGEGCISKREVIDEKTGKKKISWQGYVTVGYDTEKKKPKRKYFSGKTRKEVQDKINKVAGKVQEGTYKETEKIRVADWFNVWIEEYQKQSLRPTTWQSYKLQIDKHILPAIGHLQLNQLQTYHLQTLYNDKQKDGARLDGKPGPLSPRSVRYIHMICHACLEQAKKESRITTNPADAVKLPVDPRKEMRYFDTEQTTAFLVEARKTKHFTAYFLALNTGLRRGELLGLRWQDIDMKNGTLSVKQALVRVEGGLKFQEPKTKLSKRTIGISKAVIEELKAHRKEQQDNMKEAKDSYNKENNLIFCNELGEPICPRAFTKHFARVIDRHNKQIDKKAEKEKLTDADILKAKIPKINFHGLRHTFATLCLQQGTDPRTIQEALGHHKVAFTLDIYSGVTDKMKQEATDKIGSLLASCIQ